MRASRGRGGPGEAWTAHADRVRAGRSGAARGAGVGRSGPVGAGRDGRGEVGGPGAVRAVRPWDGGPEAGRVAWDDTGDDRGGAGGPATARASEGGPA